MADFLDRYGQWALVAGAAEGIGAAFCEELARKGMNMILVDVKRAAMELLAKKLELNYQVETIRLSIDLASEEAPELCMKAVRETRCRLLVYNAAYSRVKPFLDHEDHEMDLYAGVNVKTPLKLVHRFTSELTRHGSKGGVLLMSSLAGIYGTKYVAAYSGTKGFNLVLAEALSHELKPLGIDVSACCAGATATPGYLGSKPSAGFLSPPLMKPEQVAGIALKKLGKKTVIISGLANKIAYFLLVRILPRNWSASVVNKAMEKTYPQLLQKLEN